MQKHRGFKQLYLPIIFLCGLVPGVALASYPPPFDISLYTALEQASDQATELRRLRKKEQLADATKTRAAQAFMPRVNLESTWFRADADALGNIPSINLRSTPPGITTLDYGPVEGSVSALNLVQPLIHIEGWEGHSQASTALQARAAATEWGSQVLKLKTAQAYFGIHIQAKVLHAAQQAMHAARQVFESASANY